MGRVERETLREKYLPEPMRVLFIGESPPQGGTFFYNSDSILFDATRNGFLAAFPDKDIVSNFRTKFRSLGCYLDDLSAVPINKLSESEKRTHRKQGEEALAAKLSEWQPTAIVVVMKGIAANVQSAINRAGLGPTRHFDVLPFPVRGRFDEYVDELGAALTRLARASVLDLSRIP